MDGGDKSVWIIANWKSNKNIKEALDWLNQVGPTIHRNPHLKVVVCPQFTELEEVKKAVLTNNYPLIVGSQDLSPFGKGSFTGEESAESLKQFADLVILGHSERRKNFGETDEMVKEKVEQAEAVGIIPLVCVQDQNVPIPDRVKLIAYEPTFAIGTGNPDTPENAEKVANMIKKSHPNVQVLYGGSVTLENAKAFLKQPHIEGLLIGKASLDAEHFIKIVESCGTL